MLGDKQLEQISQRTQVRFCNEFDVCSGDTLEGEFEKFPLDRHYHFVAIVVGDIRDKGNVIRKYNVKERRRSLYLQDLRTKIWIWDVEVDGINFVIFGPHDFTDLPTSDEILLRIISAKKKEMPEHATVFNIIAPKQHVRQPEERPPESHLQEDLHRAFFDAAVKQNRNWMEETYRDRDASPDTVKWEITLVEPHKHLHHHH